MKKLFIVEGLPCSGKSTTSKYIAEQLLKYGKNVVYIDEETGNHPADYEFHAFVKECELIQFSSELQSKIVDVAEHRLDGYIIPLSNFSGDDLECLINYKIYDFLPWEIEMPLMLDKWNNFVKEAMNDDKIYVFNCILLQNPMCETMMRFGYDEMQSFEYISKIAELIKPLEPTVIYLAGSQMADKIKRTADERVGWLDSVIDYHVNGNYGKSIHAEGFEGYIECLMERQRREQKILDKLSVSKIILTDADKNWNDAYNTIDLCIRDGN